MSASEHCEGCLATSLTIGRISQAAQGLVRWPVATALFELQTAVTGTRIVSPQLHSGRSLLLQPRSAISVKLSLHLWSKGPFFAEKFEVAATQFVLFVNYQKKPSPCLPLI